MPTPTTLSYDPFQTAGGSGTANVPTGQSTGSQYQGADIADDLLFPMSGANTVSINAPVQFTNVSTFASGGTTTNLTIANASTTLPSNAFTLAGLGSSSGVWELGQSGGGSSTVTVVASGSHPTAFAAGSFPFSPAAFFFVTVPTSFSGTVQMKVPLFNS